MVTPRGEHVFPWGNFLVGVSGSSRDESSKIDVPFSDIECAVAQSEQERTAFLTPKEPGQSAGAGDEIQEELNPKPNAMEQFHVKEIHGGAPLAST